MHTLYHLHILSFCEMFNEIQEMDIKTFITSVETFTGQNRYRSFILTYPYGVEGELFIKHLFD